MNYEPTTGDKECICACAKGPGRLGDEEHIDFSVTTISTLLIDATAGSLQ